jgi:hypothetical protein
LPARAACTATSLSRILTAAPIAGIRKLISVAADDGVADGGLPSGVEVTYSVVAVDTLDQVQRLPRGDAIEVLYQE